MALINFVDRQIHNGSSTVSIVPRSNMRGIRANMKIRSSFKFFDLLSNTDLRRFILGFILNLSLFSCFYYIKTARNLGSIFFIITNRIIYLV